MFKSTDHIGIAVKDRDKSLKFYEEHFGFVKYFEADTPVKDIEKVVFIKNGDMVIELMHMPAAAVNSGYHICLKSDNFDADYERLVGAGLEIETKALAAPPRQAEEEGWKRAVFVGPDGEKIEIRG